MDVPSILDPKNGFVSDDLNGWRNEITAAASRCFIHLVSLPESVRKDEKKRTGIQVLVREPGTRNLVYESIYEPSEAAKFFSVEKAVRSYLRGDVSSTNSENPEKMEYTGSITYVVIVGEKYLQVSVSGLKAEEDVTIAIIVTAAVVKVPPLDIMKRIQEMGGKLPDVLFDKDGYLYRMLADSDGIFSDMWYGYR